MAHSLREEREKYITDLDFTLRHVTNTLRANPKVQRLILYGSYASGRRDLFTDLDILVVMDSKQDFITRSAALRQSLHSGVDMDLMVYTPQEFEIMQEKGFLKHALKNSQVLYERK
jgi:predicted nucleotidyltransferase